jgi:GDP-D-mannose 3',5'-epimerase
MISYERFCHAWLYKISGKDLEVYNIDGEEFEAKYGHKCPIGVNGRNSDNTLYREKIGWEVSQPLYEGMEMTYNWIMEQVKKNG